MRLWCVSQVKGASNGQYMLACAVKTLQEDYQELQYLWQRAAAADRLEPGSVGVGQHRQERGSCGLASIGRPRPMCGASSASVCPK